MAPPTTMEGPAQRLKDRKTFGCGTAQAALLGRWTQHKLGSRPNEPSYRLEGGPARPVPSSHAASGYPAEDRARRQRRRGRLRLRHRGIKKRRISQGGKSPPRSEVLARVAAGSGLLRFPLSGGDFYLASRAPGPPVDRKTEQALPRHSPNPLVLRSTRRAKSTRLTPLTIW